LNYMHDLVALAPEVQWALSAYHWIHATIREAAMSWTCRVLCIYICVYIWIQWWCLLCSLNRELKIVEHYLNINEEIQCTLSRHHFFRFLGELLSLCHLQLVSCSLACASSLHFFLWLVKPHESL
jgi:hypothetical protein